jgi:hypothetical protein
VVVCARARGIKAGAGGGIALATKFAGWLDRYFYFCMTLLVAAVIVYGFSHTVGESLIHPAIPRPGLLYLHAAVFSAWLAFYIFQSALIRTHNVRVHRLTGWFGVGLGAMVPPLGIATAITMVRFNTLNKLDPNAAAFMIVQFFDMVCFTITFALAIYWRKKPEFHRRLILIATCALAAAGFGRFPAYLLPPTIFYAGVDLLILLGVARDWIVNGKIHRVYRYALPAFIAGQTVVMYTEIHHAAYWMNFANAIIGRVP